MLYELKARLQKWLRELPDKLRKLFHVKRVTRGEINLPERLPVEDLRGCYGWMSAPATKAYFDQRQKAPWNRRKKPSKRMAHIYKTLQ